MPLLPSVGVDPCHIVPIIVVFIAAVEAVASGCVPVITAFIVINVFVFLVVLAADVAGASTVNIAVGAFVIRFASDVPAAAVVDVVAETVTPGVIPSFPDVVIEAGVVIDAAAVVGVVASAVATADVVVGVVTAEAAFVVTATATVGAVVGMVVGVVVG
eukprot:scpid105355/ scgid18099/ 